MLLYHFTSTQHLEVIRRSRFLKVTDSMLFSVRSVDSPPACWFFDTPEVPSGYKALESAVDKQQVRISVSVPDSWVVKWLWWAEAQGIDFSWLSALVEAAGGIDMYEHEFVTFRTVPQRYWAAVDILY